MDELESSEDSNNEPVSKSERKRQMHRLQSLGETLVQLKQNQLDELPLSELLKKAISQTLSITKHEAKRRHLQYIGKLMRKEENQTIEKIGLLLERIKLAHQQSSNKHHQIEDWRDRILNGGDKEIEHFLQAFPQADRQRLRQIWRQHQQELQHSKPPAAARKLFQYTRDIMNQ